MDRRINTRVVDTAGAALGTLIEDNASEVWWFTVSPEAPLTMGVLQIFDGQDANGKLVWQREITLDEHSNFIPPIHCEYGVFVVNDLHIAVYTIAWRPKKWTRPPTGKADVIEHPET